MPPPVLEVPRAELPSYKPLVVPPNTLRPPPGIQGIDVGDEPPQEEEKQEQKDQNINPTKQVTKPNIDLPPEAQIIQVPFTDIEVPMPTTTIMTTAATTAFISVVATLTATSLFKYIVMILKPVFKQTWSKLTKKKEPKVS
mgnify:CR=1 FL=1|jgi:hypothetical protein